MWSQCRYFRQGPLHDSGSLHCRNAGVNSLVHRKAIQEGEVDSLRVREHVVGCLAADCLGKRDIKGRERP